MKIRWPGQFAAALLALASLSVPTLAWSQNVKITPLGSHTGELCASTGR